MRVVWIALSSLGIGLQLLLIVALLRSGLKRLRILFAYLVVLFLTTVVEAAAFYNPRLYAQTSGYYWIIDSLRQVLIFLVVLSFIDEALGRKANLAAVRRLLWGGAAIFVTASLYTSWQPAIGRWMTGLSRDLGFLAVVLNLVLWAVLLQYRRSDRVLLIVTGGMGIQMAGKAIGHSLRQISPATLDAGNLLLVVTHILCLYIWWSAFRRSSPALTGGNSRR